MPLLNRFARLFTADLHAVLDRLEEPDVLLKQALREMEEEFAAMQAQISVVRHERDAGAAERQALLSALGRLDEELSLCFSAGHDELARSLVRRKLELDQRQQALGARVAAQSQCEQELTAALAAAGQRLDEMRQQLMALVESPASAGRCRVAPVAPAVVIGEDEVEIALLRERSRRSAS